MTASPEPTPFLLSLSDHQVDEALAAKRTAVETKRIEIETLSAQLAQLNRELLALEHDQLRRRGLARKAAMAP